MSSKKQQPKWWQVYVALPVLLGLFWPETHARMTGTDHILAELGILVSDLRLHADVAAGESIGVDEQRAD